MKGEPLKNVIDINELKDNKLNLIEAPCAAGKTSFAVEILAKKYGADKTVILIDTILGKEQLMQRDECINLYQVFLMNRVMPAEVFDEWIETQITVMTYAEFAKRYRENKKFPLQFKCIVCDEIHNLSNFANWDNAKKHYDRTTSDNHLAIDLITALAKRNGHLVVAMTATPNPFINTYKEKKLVNRIIPKGEVRHYENNRVHEYSSLDILLNDLDPRKIGIIYVPRITQIKQYVDKLKSRGIKAEGIWSIRNEEHEMSKEQLEIRGGIVKDKTLPDNLQVLFINKSCETSINIESHVDYVIVHSSDKDVQTQARGRFRGDLEDLYLLDPSKSNDIINLDNKWLETELDENGRALLAEEIGIKKNGVVVKWPTIRKLLLESGFYVIKDFRRDNKRYVIIYEEL